MKPPLQKTSHATEAAGTERRRLGFETSLRRGDALLALESRAARLRETSPALGFAGFSALLAALLPRARADREKLAEAISLPETTLADLGRGNHTAIELRADAVATLAVAMHLPEAEFVELVARDAAAQRASDVAAELTPYTEKDVARMTTALTAAYQEAARELGDPAAGADLPAESPLG